MNLRTLTDTIKSEGGVSYSLTYGKVKPKGYAVSPYKERELQLPLNEFDSNTLQSYVLENADLLAKEAHFLGAWIDNNTVYLDVSIQVSQKQIAVRIAKQSDQIAIFDLSNNKSIEI